MDEHKDYKRVISLPNQKVSLKTKLTKSWQKESIEYFISGVGRQEPSRKNRTQIQEIYNFYNEYLSDSEIKRHLDPMNVDKEAAVSEEERDAFSFFDIIKQPLDTLFGEHLRREFEVRAYATNPDVINEKDRMFKEEVKQRLKELAQSEEEPNPQEVQKELEGFDRMLKEDVQTAHEKMVNSILKVLQNDNRFRAKHIFHQGMINYELLGEVILKVDNIGPDPVIRKVRSDKFTVLGLGDSQFVEDGYAWIEERDVSAMQVIKEFANELTDNQIRKILENTEGGIYNPVIKYSELDKVYSEAENIPYMLVPTDGYDENGLVIADASGITGTDNASSAGNLTITHVEWISLKKIGKLTYPDDDGVPQYTWVPESYEVLEELDETVEWFWVQEIWEATKVLDFYLRVRPLPVQMRTMSNPFVVKPSYVGYVNSLNGTQPKSRFDRLIPYQRQFNTWMNKLIELWTQNIGKVAIVDLARLPKDMDTNEWYIWLKRFKIQFENSFQQGNKGLSKGTLAGNMQQSNRTVDLSLAQEINQAVQMLTWIEERVNKIAAVPAPRQGQMSGDEGLGVSQQAIVQSSQQTEFDFYILDTVEVLTYERVVEYCKVLWRDEKFKKQYLLDDLSTYLLEVDGALLNESEYGIKITNSSKMATLNNAMSQLSHAAMQTGTATLSDIASMMMSTTPSEMLNKLQLAEEKRIQQQQQGQQAQLEARQKELEQQVQLAQLQHQQELEKLELEWKYRMMEAELKFNYDAMFHADDQNHNGIEDAVELEKEEIKKEAKVLELRSKEKIEREKMQNQLKIARISASKPKAK